MEQHPQLLVYKASAGSGKTFTLAVHYIRQLIEDPYAYRRILAVTFTNKATAEMKERILEQLYGIDVSPTMISNITNKIMPTIKEWQNRPLQSTYAFVFLDAIHYKVKQDGMIVNKASYMVIGIDMDGRKDVLGIWIGENETSKFWLVVLNELKNRGVEDILVISVDNLKGFNEAISACYPRTEIQKCIVHQVRNSVRFVNYKDLKKVTWNCTEFHQWMRLCNS